MMPMSAQSSLSHCTTTRPGMVAGSSGTTESSCPWQITMPPECWPRWRGRSCTAMQSSKNLRRRGWLRSRPASWKRRSSASLASLIFPGGDGGGNFVQRFRIEAQRLAHFARGRAAAIGDDVGGHGGAELAVALVDVLDDALALIAAGQVEIDVGPLAALFGEKALEQQFHADGIDGGDAERIADGAVGGRAAALHQDVLLAAEAHDVPDDEEVAGEVELLDQMRVRARSGGGRAVAGPL